MRPCIPFGPSGYVEDVRSLPSKPDVEVVSASDDALLDAARAGDRRAQQRLLVPHLSRLKALLTRLAGANDADDLLQNTLLEALGALPRFRGEAPLALWLDRIATHMAYKHFRSAKRLRARVLFGLVPVATGPDPRRRLEARDALGRARLALEELTPDRRIIFVLVAVEGRTIEEAAAMLDVSLSAAKSRFLRARRQVDRRLAQLEREEGA